MGPVERALEIVLSGQTNVDVLLRRPLPLLAARGDGSPLGEVRFYADQPRQLATRLRAGTEESRGTDVGKLPR